MDTDYLKGGSVQENCCHSDTIQNAADTNVNAQLTEEDEKSFGMETEKNSLLSQDEEKKSLNPGDEKLDEKKLYNHNEVENESTVDIIETRKENEQGKRDFKEEIDEIESKSKKSDTPEKSEHAINQTSESKTNEASESETAVEKDRSDEGEKRSESKGLDASEHILCNEIGEDSNACGETEESSNENVLNASSENLSCNNEAITKNEESQPIVNTKASEVVSDESELPTNGQNRDHSSDSKDSPNRNEDENEDSPSSIDEERQEEKGTCASDEVNIKVKSGGENVVQGEITPLKTYSEEEKVTCSGDHLKTSGEILKSDESNEEVTSSTENDTKEEITLSGDDSEHGGLKCNEDDLNSNKEILKTNDSEKVTSSDETDKQEETTPLKHNLEEGKNDISEVHLTSSEEKLKFDKSEKVTVTSSVETDQQEDITLVQTDVEGKNVECGDDHSNSEKENLDEGHEHDEGRKEKSSGHSEINKLVSSDESQSDDENHKDKKEGDGTTADIFSTGKDVENSDVKEAVGSDDIKKIIGDNIVQNFDEDSFDLNINVNLSKSQDNSVTEFSAGMINNLELPSHNDEKIYQSKVVLDRVDIEAASTPRKSYRRSVHSANKTSGCKSGQQNVSPTSGRRETRKRGLFSSTDSSPENKYFGLCAEDLPKPTVILERVDIVDGAAAEESVVQASDKSTRSQRKISSIREESAEDDHTRNFRKPGPRCATKRRQVAKESADVPSRKSGRSSMSEADSKAINTSRNPGTIVNKGIHSTRSQYRNLKVRIDQSEWRKWREVANDEEFQPAVVVEQLSPDTTTVGQFFTQDENEASTSTDTRRSQAIHGTSASPQYQPKVVVDKLFPEQAAQHKFPFGDDTEASTSTGRKKMDAISHDEPGSSKYQPRVMLDKIGADSSQGNSGVQCVVKATEAQIEEAVMEENMKFLEGKGFKCKICEGFYKTKNALIQHVNCHASSRPYACQICLRKFTTKKYFTAHKEAHARKSISSSFCCICKISFKSAQDLSKHVKKHKATYAKTSLLKFGNESESKGTEGRIGGEIKNPAPDQNVGTVSSSSEEMICSTEKEKEIETSGTYQDKSGKLFVHEKEGNIPSKEKISYDVKRHVCFECGRYFSFAADLEKHSFFHNKAAQSAQMCKICKRKFSNSSKLKTHLRTHKLNREVRCRECGKKFCHLFLLEKHSRKSHGASFLCTVCGELCRNNMMLNVHLLSHADRQNSTCLGCQRKFISWFQLRLHLKSGCSNVYLCDKCSTVFVDRRVYVNHILESSCGKFQCKICGKQFQQRRHYLAHFKTHHDIFPYKCEFCPRSFSDRLSLILHTGIHFSNKNLHCVLCDKVANCRRTFVHHWLRNHEKRKCQICYRYFGRSKRKGIKDKKSEDALCRRCNAYFINQYQKRPQRQVFHMKSWFVCKLCNHSCVSKYRLHTHLKMHLEKFLPILKKRSGSFLEKAVQLDELSSKENPSTSEICDPEDSPLLSDIKMISKSYDEIKRKVCSICGLRLANEFVLKRHVKRKHPTKITRTCGICGLTLRHDFTLKKHCMSFHNEGNEKSEEDVIVDNKRQTRSKSLSVERDGMNKNLSTKKRAIEGVRYLRGRSIRQEEMYGDEEGKYGDGHYDRLSSNGKKKKSKSAVFREEDSFSDDKEDDGKKQSGCDIREKKKLKYACSDCGMKFHTNYHRDRHLRRYHKYDHLNMEILKDRKAPMKCRICGIQYSSLYGVERHMRRHHADENIDTKCPVCGKIFYNEYNVMIHVKQIHTAQDYQQNPEKKQEDDVNEACKCLRCGCCFRYRRNLYKHLKKIHQVKEFGESDIQHLTLEEYDKYLHENSGTRGDFKKYSKCQHCNQSVYLPVLQRHLKTCHGNQSENRTQKVAEKVAERIACSKCGKTFTHRVYLLRHDKYYQNNDMSCTDEIPLAKFKSMSSKGTLADSQNLLFRDSSRKSLARATKSKSEVNYKEEESTEKPQKAKLNNRRRKRNQPRSSSGRFTKATESTHGSATPFFAMDNLMTIIEDDGTMYTAIDLTKSENIEEQGDVEIIDVEESGHQELRQQAGQSESAGISDSLKGGNIPAYNVELVEIDDCKICEIVPPPTSEDNEFVIDVENLETNESSHSVTVRL